ncbi:helix-turn-helix transcriptional regulator [Rhodococcus triatomae]|nr:DNA-binding HTH domain-containing protein [Rhodococcus triatomae BKS 15-14]
MHSPLLGARRAAIDDIAAALTLALDGVGPSTLVLTAGPGSGKTHTLRALVTSVDVATRWATADELSWRQPYAVASALLGVELPATVPARYDDRLDEALESLAAREPHLVVIDDAHNADAGSLECLGRLASAATDLPVVLLVARRHLPARELLTRLVSRRFVREWQLPPMDSADLEVLAHEMLGAWPDDRLSSLLAGSGGNPMHARALIDDLRSQGHLVVAGDRATTRGVDTAASPASLHAVIRDQLALLDDGSRALVQKLAVWGGPATLDDIAVLDDVPPSALVGAAQTGIDSGVLVFSRDGTMVFTHDVYADVAYEALDPALRSVLHAAIARSHEAAGNHQLVAHHVMEAGVGDSAAAVTRAQEELEHVPAVVVDLLDTAASKAATTGPPVRTLELDLATALARSGQLARAADVAKQGLTNAADLDTVARLHRILLFTLIAQGRTAEVLELTDATLRLPVDPRTRAALLDIQRYVAILAGSAPVPREPFVLSEAATPSELVTESLRRFLAGHGAGGLELAVEASRREGEAGDGPVLSTSADVWPPFIEQYVHGPVAAEALLDRATRLRTDRGAAWMTAYHDFIRGGVAMSQGRLDDAAASFDSGLERAADAGLGWTSIAEGSRAMIDVFRGNFSSAAARLEKFAESGALNQFGLPVPAQSEMLLLEARRKLRLAVAMAHACCTTATDLGLYGWFPSIAVDCARIAHRTGDDALAEQIVAALAEMSELAPEARLGPIALSRALCSGDGELILAASVECAGAAHELGDAVTEAAGWEEAACAAATLGDRATAREHAHSALVITQNMGADALSVRITSRLRALGPRLDPRAVRDRPRTGWDSLTRTEATIAELVAAGFNGTEIARKMYISQRTVQTHVSHALAKMGLRTRVELAAAVARRDPEPVL